MELHRQTCQLCGSHDMRNILVREVGEPEKVFVQCADCKEMVARYIIQPGGYYHHHRGFESYVRSFKGMGQAMSGSSIKKEYEKIQEDCVVSFQRVKKLLAEMGKED